MKICTGCKETKPLTEFYGKLAQCKHCNKRKRESLTEEEIIKKKEYAQKWRDANKEKTSEYGKIRYGTFKSNEPPKPPKLPSDYKCLSNEEKSLIYERKRIKAEENLPLYLWHGAKRRSINKSLEFNIEVSDIIVPEFCPILGLPLKINRGIKDNSISLDRVDSSKGYIKGNILVISYLANSMKRNANFETLQKFALWVLSLESLQLETCLS